MIKKYLVSIITLIVLASIAVIGFYVTKPVTTTGDNNPFLTVEFWQTATPADVEKIIQSGGDVNALDASKKTPLMFAAHHAKNPDVLMTLLDNGADRTLWSAEQKRAVNYAMDNPNVKGTQAFKAINNVLVSTTHR